MNDLAAIYRIPSTRAARKLLYFAATMKIREIIAAAKAKFLEFFRLARMKCTRVR